MDKYQIVETTEQFNHAGTKATADISVVAEKMGFQKLYLKMRTTKSGYLAKAQRQVGYYIDWNNCYQAITEGSVVLLQHPFHYPQLTRDRLLYKLKKEKKVKFISVVHDVEELRAFRYNDYYKREFEVMLDIADVIIVHNQVMLDWFVGRGVPREKLVNLKLFDYLIDAPTPKKVDFEMSINIAGNLHSLTGDFFQGHIGLVIEGFGGGHGIISAAADTDNSVIGFHNLTGAGNNQRCFAIGDNHKSLQLAQIFIHTPVFCQFNRGAFQLVGVFFQFGLKPLNQSYAVRSRAGKSGNDLAVADTADFNRLGFENNGFAKSSLTVAGHYDFIIFANT